MAGLPVARLACWAELEACQEEIAARVKGGVPVVKIGILLARQGVVVAERTLHRFAAERCGAGGSKVTTPVDDGPPGGELQVDFGDLGLIPAGDGRRRKLRALVFTACFSRYMFVYLTFSMTLEEVIVGCEDAWEFFSDVCVIFLFASAGASSAYLTVSETFPVEIRAEAIAVFFAIAQVFGAVGPILFGALIGAGHDPSRLFIGYVIGSAITIAGGIVEVLLGVKAEGRQLEQVARPLSAVTATQVPRAPLAEAQHSPSARPAGPSSVAA